MSNQQDDNMMHLSYVVSGTDFTRAGEASGDVKRKLKTMGADPGAVRKVSIAMYEGEINMVIHANGGSADVTVGEEYIEIVLADKGPGIPDIDLAMQEGYSTARDNIRALGFGAGMGLPNMKKNSDTMEIKSKKGEGTHIVMRINI